MLRNRSPETDPSASNTEYTAFSQQSTDSPPAATATATASTGMNNRFNNTNKSNNNNTATVATGSTDSTINGGGVTYINNRNNSLSLGSVNSTDSSNHANSSIDSDSHNNINPALTNLTRIQKFHLLDWTVLLILLITEGLIQLIPPHRRLVLDTDAISYPLLTETIPVSLLFVLAVIFPLILFCAIVYYSYNRNNISINQRAAILTDFHHLIRSFLFCILLTLISTDFIKKLVGRPRPNFLALAQWINNTSYTGPTAVSVKVNEAFQSFISGHASLAFAGLTFLSLFLFQRISSIAHYQIQLQQYYNIKSNNQNRIIQPPVNQMYLSLIVAAPMFLAAYIGITRITDYWHFYEDVLGGSLVGLGWAFTIYFTHYSSMRSAIQIENQIPISIQTTANGIDTGTDNNNNNNSTIIEINMDQQKSSNNTTNNNNTNKSTAILSVPIPQSSIPV